MRKVVGYKKKSCFFQALIVFCLTPFLPLTLIYLRVNVSTLKESITFTILGIYIIGLSFLLYMLYLITTPSPLIEIEHDKMFLHFKEDLKEISLSEVTEVKVVENESHPKHAKLLIETIEEKFITETVKDYKITCDEIMKHAKKYQRVE